MPTEGTSFQCSVIEAAWADRTGNGQPRTSVFFLRSPLNFCGVVLPDSASQACLTLCPLSAVSISDLFLPLLYPEEFIVGLFCPTVSSKSYKLRQGRNLLKNIRAAQRLRGERRSRIWKLARCVDTQEALALAHFLTLPAPSSVSKTQSPALAGFLSG